MRVLPTTRGEGCVQVGRVLDGNDGRFHELPVSTAFDTIGCALLDAQGRLVTNVTAKTHDR